MQNLVNGVDEDKVYVILAHAPKTAAVHTVAQKMPPYFSLWGHVMNHALGVSALYLTRPLATSIALGTKGSSNTTSPASGLGIRAARVTESHLHGSFLL